ncbi:MAG: Stk1 family PASTA domain-containing Ser/Thr kinase [Nakamurella sp.]
MTTVRTQSGQGGAGDPRHRGGLSGSLLDGRYRIGSVIARGGMSTVYRGLDTRLDRPVAVKVMSAQYADDPAFLTRFSREARLAAGLSHSGVVAVYDHGRDGDHTFLVMELIDGGTLRDLLHQRGPQGVAVTLSILEALLDALAAAHRAGLVHRDVKPENVLISARGELKVADFGLVRAVTSQTMATGDVILGTVAYLSPEQVERGTSDTRSDVYSAGIVGWELLVGEPPFTGENAMSVAYQHVHSDVPLLGDEVDGVPAALEDLIGDATQRDPEIRPRDAGEFAAGIRQIRRDLAIPRVPIPVPTRPQPVAATDDPDADVPLAGRTDGRPRPTRIAGAVLDPVAPLAPDERATFRTSAATYGPAAGAGHHGTRVMTDPPRATAHAPRGAPTTRTPAPQVAPLRRRRVPRWLIILLAMLLLGAAVGAGGWWLADGRWAYAPATEGLTQQQAERVVRAAGLIPQVSVHTDDSAKVGTIADATPGAGARMLRGSAVALVVSTGRPTVPEVLPGTAQAVAEALLTDAGLRAELAGESEYSSDVPRGSVLRTDPSAGSPSTPGMTVSMVLSLGTAPAPIPDVAGKSPEDATNKLIVAGFRLDGAVAGYDATLPDGVVVGTKPGAGQRITPGSRVALVINSSAVVPDLRSRSLAEATESLAADGWTVTAGEPVFDPAVTGGAVVGSSPAAGGRVDPAQKVIALTPSSAVTVPDLSTGTMADAARTARTVGLAVDVRGWWVFASSQVRGQEPAAGSLVAPGATIVLSAGF